MAVTTTETRILNLLRKRYEVEGYTFIEYPSASILPAFMDGYQPDALALGDDKSIAIEVKLRRDATTEKKLRILSKQFLGQQGWELRVFYGDEFKIEPISTATIEQINDYIYEAEHLLAQNHASAALLIGWATIEALARSANQNFPPNGSLKQAIDYLEHLGRLDFTSAQRLRPLLGLRNKIIHGDFSTSVTTAEVEPVITAARMALEAV